MLSTILAFAVAIGVLVTFHEFGHYWVARRCGVKVLRFSIGFGRPLFSVRWRGTEWSISPIPLGGYVKMLDEREMDVPAHERHLAFHAQPVSRRRASLTGSGFTPSGTRASSKRRSSGLRKTAPAGAGSAIPCPSTPGTA